MIGFYLRVSTTEQNLKMQEHVLKEWHEKNHPEVKVRYFRDIGISGSHTRRPGYQRLMKQCEKGTIKHVVVYKLDRLTRDSATAIRLVLDFDEMNVQFTSVTQPMFNEGKVFRHAMIAIFGELAQMERENIVERIKSGMEAAKKRGVKFGAPVKITPEIQENIIKYWDNGKHSYRAVAKKFDLGLASISKVLSEHKKLNSLQDVKMKSKKKIEASEKVQVSERQIPAKLLPYILENSSENKTLKGEEVTLWRFKRMPTDLFEEHRHHFICRNDPNNLQPIWFFVERKSK